jgi:hypothetical protein
MATNSGVSVNSLPSDVVAVIDLSARFIVSARARQHELQIVLPLCKLVLHPEQLRLIELLKMLRNRACILPKRLPHHLLDQLHYKPLHHDGLTQRLAH